MRNTLVAALVLFLCIACAPGEPEAPAAEAPPVAGAPTAAEASAARGTLDEARALLDAAAAHYEAMGREAALAAFTAGEAPFVDRDLYVFCYGPDRTVSAHGANPALIGDAIDELRDIDDKAFGTEIFEVGSQPGGGTVEYQWLNPLSGEVEPKVSVVRQLGEDVCGVGAYQSQP